MTPPATARRQRSIRHGKQEEVVAQAHRQTPDGRGGGHPHQGLPRQAARRRSVCVRAPVTRERQDRFTWPLTRPLGPSPTPPQNHPPPHPNLHPPVPPTPPPPLSS